MKRIPLFVRVLPVYVLIIGLVLFPMWQQKQHQKAVQSSANAASAQISSKPIKTKKQVSGKPVRILIPRLGIDLPVVDGVYSQTSKSWSVSGNMANYATITAPINNLEGGTLIYGHALEWVFGKTRDLKPGDIAYVYTNNKHVFSYKFTGRTIVSPSDTSIFKDLTHGPELALLSCDGAWSQNRRIMSFHLQAAS